MARWRVTSPVPCPCCQGARQVLEPSELGPGLLPVRCQWCAGVGTRAGFLVTSIDEEKEAA